MKYSAIQKSRIYKEGIDYFKTVVSSDIECISLDAKEQQSIQNMIDARKPISYEFYGIFESKLNIMDYEEII